MNLDKLPRLLKEPTGWIMLILVSGFFYMQWPTHVRSEPEPAYFEQKLANGFHLRWEQEPQLQSAAQPKAWGVTRKGMSFLLQTGQLTEPFEDLVRQFETQDKTAVGGAVQQPLVVDENSASYALFDAESRVQEHKVFQRDGQWIKVSVLYKPSMDSRVQRAADFMGSAYFIDDSGLKPQ